jgi:hypothetical protein
MLAFDRRRNGNPVQLLSRCATDHANYPEWRRKTNIWRNGRFALTTRKSGGPYRKAVNGASTAEAQPDW